MTKKWIKVGLWGLWVLCLAGCLAKPDPLRGRIVDLTHSYDEQTIYWPTEAGFLLEKESEGVTAKGYFYSANRFTSAEHGGTHMDAPYHFSKEGNTVDTIPLERLIGPGHSLMSRHNATGIQTIKSCPKTCKRGRKIIASVWTVISLS